MGVERRAEADMVGDEREFEGEHAETDDSRREKFIRSNRRHKVKGMVKYKVQIR